MTGQVSVILQQQLKLPDACQDEQCSPSGQAVRTVHHSTIHTCRATLFQLSRAELRVGPALYGRHTQVIPGPVQLVLQLREQLVT